MTSKVEKEAPIIITRRKVLSPLSPRVQLTRNPWPAPLLWRLPHLTVNWQWLFIVRFDVRKKQMSEKKIFWILLACGPCGIDCSILLFCFPKVGSYESHEGWGIGLTAFLVHGVRKRESPTTLPKLGLALQRVSQLVARVLETY